MEKWFLTKITEIPPIAPLNGISLTQIAFCITLCRICTDLHEFFSCDRLCNNANYKFLYLEYSNLHYNNKTDSLLRERDYETV